MADLIAIQLPKLGESIVNARVVQWLKKVGDHIGKDEALLEVSTDKINSEIPSPVSGVLSKILVDVDVEADVGAPLALIELQALSEEQSVQINDISTQVDLRVESEEKKDFFSPSVLNMARESKIPLEELSKIAGTGAGGRVTKKDVADLISLRMCSKPTSLSEIGSHLIPKDDHVDIELMKLTGIRKAIADNMVKSFYEAPHASLIAEVDVTSIVKLIKNNKEAFLKEHGYKLTITSYILEAIASSAQQFPIINASLEEDTIVIKRFINIGIAVSLEKGLVVPVIKDCHKKDLISLAGNVADLSSRARSAKLTQDDVSKGTITMTNFGMSGTLIGIPIIRNPEVAIVGIGAIHKKVAVLEDDTFGVRSVVNITLTFDHRIIDGMYGAGFLNLLKQILEKRG